MGTDTETKRKQSAVKEKAPLRPVESPMDICLGCGTCSAGCAMTGVDGFDPRKIVRKVLMGRDAELVGSKLPWICTMCGKCEHACPMGINIVNMIRTLRGMVDRDKVPGMIQKGVELCLETGNNLGLPAEDFTFIIEDVAAEMAEEPGFEGFTVPIDKKGANLLHTLHNKLVNTQNEDLVHWWKIFHMAGEDFTIPSENWEGVNWGLFSGDDESMKIVVGRIVEHMDRLEIKNLMYPE
ncbi:MAG: 4Fe-4S dicluster domain-containing protein [Proteobacteria bacterium]|nr:4Fe-4S dicluster domain-containing protein [Pseudomonadota bacterium]